MSRFERHARTVSLLTLLSRVTGVVRDAAFSRVFGAGLVMDAFVFAFMIPNLFRRLFGEGALAAAFLPAFAQLDRDDPETARRLASCIVSVLLTSLGALVLLGEIALLLLSSRRDHASLPLWLMMIMLPYMPMVCTVAVLGAMLQVRGRFGPAASAPIVLNTCLIAATLGGLLLLPGGPGGDRHRLIHIGGVAGAVLVAGVGQLAWSLLALRGRRWWTSDVRGAGPPVRRVLRRAAPMILGLGVLQLNTFFDGLIASYPTAVGPTILGVPYPLREGAMSAVNFAQRLYQFPLGVFGIAVATAIFPALARLAGDHEAFADTVRRGLRLVVFVGLPATAGLILVREPLVAVLLEGGAFTTADTHRVALILLGYATGVWAYSMVHVLTRACYARDEAMTPVLIAVAVVALNLALNATLIWTPLREAGLAWSTALCAAIQVVALLVVLRRRIGAVLDRAVLVSWARSIAATAVMTGGLLAAAPLAAAATGTGEHRWITSAAVLLAVVTAGAVLYGAAAFAIGMPEPSWALGKRRR